MEEILSAAGENNIEGNWHSQLVFCFMLLSCFYFYAFTCTTDRHGLNHLTL